jgi:hypothetical protein
VLVPSGAKHAKQELPQADPGDHGVMAMANATAHLLSAFHLLAALDTPSSATPGSPRSSWLSGTCVPRSSR